MIEHKEHFHGSDLEKIEKYFGIKKEDIISFAANVNPLGVSPKLRETLANHIDAITSYPDREYSSLRSCMAQYCGTTKDNIVVGNGSTELISLFIQMVAPKKALMLSPTYSEYEREINLAGGSCEYFELIEDEDFKLDVQRLKNTLTNDYQLLIICNPNNPTSTAIDNSIMADILEACKKLNIFVLVDETYVEFSSDISSITSIPLTEEYTNLVVLRGTSKFFAAPGLRLGYAITGNKELIDHINKYKNPWTINSLAAIAGEIMFTDEEYIKATQDLISTEKARLFKLFEESSKYKPYVPEGNFILLKILDNKTSHELFEKCIKEGLMIRDCSTFPGLSDKFIRFCIMNPSDNDRLATLLLS